MIAVQALIVALLVLGIGAMLAKIVSVLAAALWLGLAVLAVSLYHAWFVSRLHYWSGLPQVRPVPVGFGIWRRPLDRVARHMRTEQEERAELSGELEQLRAAVDRLPDGLAVLDRFNHVEWANAPARELHGIFGSKRPVHHFLRQPEFLAYLEAGAYEQPLRLALPNRPGRVFEIRLHATDDQQKLLISRDITNQARLDAMRSDFVANVSHEIRTPITVIGGFAETMLELDLAPDERRNYLGSIVKHSHTMQRLVEDLLTLSSLESAIDRPDDEAIDLERLCESLVGDARVLSDGRHQIDCSVPAGVQLQGVPSEIESAVRNLLTNAVRYTPDGGRVSLRWSQLGSASTITVEDTGIGIRADHLPRLTERFYRVDRARSRVTGGTGLGLAIVKRIASRHGAELLIDSEPGRGSRFSLRFPNSRIRKAASAVGLMQSH